MRRFFSLFTMLMLCGVLAFAQSRVVTGKVTDIDGNPVSFATIKVKTSNTGLSADANGAYSIRVNPNDVLVISGASFKTTEVPVGTQNVFNTVMEKGVTSELKEVVVTSAFGTKRTARSTASNTQNVSGESLNTIRQTNINNALAGKVAGIQVRSQSAAKLGVETIVRLRGENGIGIGGGALYVVDGTIMPSAQDINPDDVEDVTVLQGPAAAALFGPDASNGAIVISTKKAKRSQRGIGLEINTGVQFDKVYILPDFQDTYGGGTDADFRIYNYKAGDPIGWQALDGKYYPDYTEDVSWGPRMAGQEYIPWYAWYSGSEYAYKTAKYLPQPTNVRDYFNTGVTKLNNINFSKAGEGFNVRASYTNLDQEGLIPTSYLKKNTFNINANFDLGSRFSLSANVNYINQKSNAENDDAYANQTSGSFNQWFHRNLDMNIMRELKNLRGPNGEVATWNHNNPGAYSTADNGALFFKAYYWHGPYAWQDWNTVLNTRNRVFGDVGLTYKVNNDLRVKFTYRKQQHTTTSDERQYNALDLSAGTNSGFNNFEPALNGRARTFGGYRVGQTQSNRQNYEFLATYNKKIKSFQIGIIAGGDILKTSASSLTSRTDGGLVVPDQFILTNSKNAAITTQRIDNSARRSLFANAIIGFRNFLFAEGTYRRDYISTEADPFYIDTKSVGLSFVFSDLINKNGTSFLSYGKIRASTGQILNALGIYQNNQVYAIGVNTFNGNFLMGEPNSLIDPLLAGAANDEKEVGIELRFLKNRIGLNATYWDRTNKNFPLAATVSPYTGYSSITTNAGEVKKTGIDLQLFLNPVKMNNFDWTINATWGKLLKNDVISINEKLGITTQSSQLSGNGNINMVSAVGKRWGQLRGIGIKKNAAGIPIITNDFYTPEDDVDFGSSLPDYTGGVQSGMTLFKNFVININVDYSVGGKYFSLSDFYGDATGNFKKTAGLNDKGIPMRDPVSNGGGIHVVGVDTLGKPVDMYVEPRPWFEANAYSLNIAETAIRDLTFVKLRELSIGYRLPVEKLGIGKYLTSAVFSVVSRNPWLIYVKQKGFDPSELTNSSGENGQLPGTRSLGVNLKLGF